MSEDKRPPINVGVGMPAYILLHYFGEIVHDAFGDWPYLVGSATITKQWRDVDVRLILDDETYERVIGKLDQPNKRWQALCLAFSVLGKQITGLPIDFQIQQRTQANEQYDGYRCALILHAHFEEPTPAIEAEPSIPDGWQPY